MLRRGNTASHAGAGRLLARDLSHRPSRRGQVSGAGARGQRLLHPRPHRRRPTGQGLVLGDRPDEPQVKAAIASIDPDAWTPIVYPNAVFDEAEGRWVSAAEVAEIEFVAFTSRRKRDHLRCRLVVRRVKRLQVLAPAPRRRGRATTSYDLTTQPTRARPRTRSARAGQTGGPATPSYISSPSSRRCGEGVTSRH